MPQLERLVTDAFSGLVASGRLAMESSTIDARAFGNAVVVLAGENLRVRIISDRDEVFADAASRLAPEEWYPLQRVICAAGGYPPPLEGLLSPVQAAELVEQHFSALNTGLSAAGWNKSKAGLERLGKEALARTTRRLKTYEPPHGAA